MQSREWCQVGTSYHVLSLWLAPSCAAASFQIAPFLNMCDTRLEVEDPNDGCRTTFLRLLTCDPPWAGKQVLREFQPKAVMESLRRDFLSHVVKDMPPPSSGSHILRHATAPFLRKLHRSSQSSLDCLHARDGKQHSSLE